MKEWNSKDKYTTCLLTFTCICLMVEFGIYTFRMPKEFKHSIIPKIRKAAAFEVRLKEYVNKTKEYVLNVERNANLNNNRMDRRYLDMVEYEDFGQCRMMEDANENIY